MDVNGATSPARENELANTESRLSDQLMSPFCPGRTLLACPSEEATKLRSEIRGMFRDGKSEEEIESLLVSRYGEDIRGIPSFAGFGAAAWYMPVLFLAVALLVVFRLLRRDLGQGDAVPAGFRPVSEREGKEGEQQTAEGKS